MKRVLVNRIVVGPFATNCYLVRCQGSNQCVIIDPGGDADLISYRLQEWKGEAVAVLLTHGHIDHVMALHGVNPGEVLPVYAHEAERPLLEQVSVQSQLFGLPKFPPPSISRWVRDQEIIGIGDLRFRVVHTPGHSPGGCCYQLDSEIFVGDTLFESSIGRTDLPGGDHHLLLQSITSKLFSLADDTVVYPGHGEQTTIGREKKYNPFIRGEL